MQTRTHKDALTSTQAHAHKHAQAQTHTNTLPKHVVAIRVTAVKWGG